MNFWFFFFIFNFSFFVMFLSFDMMVVVGFVDVNCISFFWLLFMNNFDKLNLVESDMMLNVFSLVGLVIFSFVFMGMSFLEELELELKSSGIFFVFFVLVFDCLDLSFFLN